MATRDLRVVLRTEFEEIQLCLTAHMETNLFIGE